MSFKKMFINLRKYVTVALLFVYLGEEEIHKFVQYEFSMTRQDAKSKKMTKMAAKSASLSI